jgi:hypothetical protein
LELLADRRPFHVAAGEYADAEWSVTELSEQAVAACRGEHLHGLGD